MSKEAAVKIKDKRPTIEVSVDGEPLCCLFFVQKRTYQIISHRKHLLFITENNNQMFTSLRRDAAEVSCIHGRQCGQRSKVSQEGSGGERD